MTPFTVLVSEPEELLVMVVPEMVQVVLAGMIKPEKLMDERPAASVVGASPVQPAGATVMVEAVVSMLDRLSVNVALVSGIFPGLFMEKVRVLVPPGAMGDVPNTLVMDGVPATTRFAVLEFGPAPLWVLVMPVTVLA